ncbi:MAG: hypothetical protein DMG30_08685 [Acidobacteria bacterium]|nr:MAG: hypothetical protein DMG30_08685 [Acidobacteriota bacterium]
MRKAPLDPRLKYPWQQTVLDSLIEYPPVRDKITAAETAIFGRLLERPTDLGEVHALRDALFALQIVFPEIIPKLAPNENKKIA